MRLAKRAHVIYKQGGLQSVLFHARDYVVSDIIRKRILSKILIAVRGLLATCISTSPGLVLLGFDNEIQGNSGRIYRRMIENDSGDLSPIWMTSNRDLYDELTSEGYPVAYERSLQGQQLLLRADIACYDKMSTYAFHDSITTVKVRHEVPVKNGPEAAKRAATPTKATKHDYIVSTSKFLAQKQVEYQRARKGGDNLTLDQFVPLGFPRNDMLFEVPDRIRKQWQDFVDDQNYDRVILYAPTRRRQEHYDIDNVDLFPFDDFSSDRLNDLLREQNALLLIRFHPSDERQMVSDDQSYSTRHEHETLLEFVNELRSYDRVRIASTDEFADTNELLQFVDVLITDYSTVYHTYLLLDQPIVFFPYDYKDAKASFDFKYAYYENLPGPAIDSFGELGGYIQELFGGNESYSDRRKELRERIHEYSDGRSTERVINFLHNLARIDE